jgi:hypothetical protein
VSVPRSSCRWDYLGVVAGTLLGSYHWIHSPAWG